MVDTALQVTWEIDERRNNYAFELRPRLRKFSVKLRDEFGVPRAGVRYRLAAGDKVYDGTTDEDGLVSQQIKSNAKQGRLTVWLSDDDPDDTLSWPLNLAPLPPIDQIAGVQIRLNNLGFDAGPVTGVMNDETKEAIREFQETMSHPNPTGELDAETRSQLASLHGDV